MVVLAERMTALVVSVLWQFGLGGDAVGGDRCADVMFGVVVGRIYLVASL